MDSAKTNPITTNSALTRRVAHVAEALAGYDHLPALGSIGVYGTVVYLHPSHSYKTDPVRDVCVWAAAFDVPVVIDLSDTGRVVVALDLGGVKARLDQLISHQQAYEYGAALGIPVSPGGQAQVDPAALLAALDARNGAAA